jgi:N4-gp56 family major capsid protein
MPNTTLLANLINPQVMADMIAAELENKLRVTGFYKVNNTLVGRAGDTITVPTWLYIGEADDLPENEQGNITEMQTKDVSYSVKKAVKNVSLTDEAVLSGYGDPVGEATRQLRMSIQDKMDSDGISLLEGITIAIGHVYTVTAMGLSGMPVLLEYEDIIDALNLMPKDNEEQGINATLLVSSNTAKVIRKNPRFIERQTTMGDNILTSGSVGSLAGCSILISNKLTDTRSFILTPQCLTAFMKRDVNVEEERQMLFKRTLIGADCHYVIAIEDYDKIVAIDHPDTGAA